MKKIAFAVAALLIAATPAMAGSARSNTGCGLGTLLWGNKADNSMVSQAFQSTTNGIGSQTIAITLGTLECNQPSKVVDNERLNHFVRANMDNLARDIAQGRGESLDAFAELLNVPTNKRTDFYAALQKNFSAVFTSENVVLAEVIDNAVTVAN